MVEGAALEMLCGETHLGFESLTLRQKELMHGISSFFMLSIIEYFISIGKDYP